MDYEMKCCELQKELDQYTHTNERQAICIGAMRKQLDDAEKIMSENMWCGYKKDIVDEYKKKYSIKISTKNDI